MKKFFISFFALSAFAFSALAQVDHDYSPNEVVPILTSTLSKDQIPAAIVKSVNTDFAMDKPLTWSKFPFALQEYGWVYDKAAAGVKPDHYEVTMKTNNNTDLSAIYSSTGILIETKEEFTNAPLPQNVIGSLAKSQYKDWKVVGNKEVIKYYHDANSVEQHFRITVENGNVRRSISFNYQSGN
jgi:hypothetical protein